MTRQTRKARLALQRAITAITAALEDFTSLPVDSPDRRKLLTTIQDLEEQRDKLT